MNIANETRLIPSHLAYPTQARAQQLEWQRADRHSLKFSSSSDALSQQHLTKAACSVDSEVNNVYTAGPVPVFVTDSKSFTLPLRSKPLGQLKATDIFLLIIH